MDVNVLLRCNVILNKTDVVFDFVNHTKKKHKAVIGKHNNLELVR